MRGEVPVLTTAVEVEGGLGSINGNGDWSNGGHSFLEIRFTSLLHIYEASEGGANIFLIEAARAILRAVKRDMSKIFHHHKKIKCGPFI